MSIHHGRDLPGALTLETDVVIVGSGASGAVVAAQLAKAEQRVVILEEGPHIPQSRYGAMRTSEHMRHLWREAGMTFVPGLGDSPVINLTMGRVVGGSSVLTGGVCFRVPESVLAVWRTERGLPGFTPEELEPYYADVEKTVHVEEVPAAMRSRSSALFAEGAAKQGFAMKPLRRNTDGCKGYGRCNFGCPHGAKMSVDLSYLPTALAHGAELYADCLVDRILVRGDRAAGVVGRVLNGPNGAPGAPLTVLARRVVIAAGAFHTPLLLLASGVGRASGQVGRNMTLHPGFRVMARFDEPVHGWRGALQSCFSDAFEHERITLISLFVPPAILAATMPGVGRDHLARAAMIPHIALFGAMIHDDGGGVVRRGPGREPLATYTMAREDRAAASRAIRILAETYLAAGAREVFLPVLGIGGMDADKLRKLDLDRVPGRQLETGSQHPLGTCRMGASADRSVVDSEGRAWDLRELYLADGSIVPTSLGVNPQLTIMTLARRLAERMLERPLPDAPRARSTSEARA